MQGDKSNKMNMANISAMMAEEPDMKKKRIAITAIVYGICAIVMAGFWLNAFDRTVKAQQYAEDRNYTGEGYIYDVSCTAGLEMVPEEDGREAAGWYAVFRWG